MNTQFRYYTSFPAFIKDTGNGVCFTQFLIKTLKKSLGKLLRCLQIKVFGNILPCKQKVYTFSSHFQKLIRDPPLELSK